MKQLLLKSKKSNLPFSFLEKKQVKKSTISITTNMLKCLFVVLLLTPFVEVSAQFNYLDMAGNYQEPTSGYSLRRLSSTYNGSAVQVRRTGDNALKDIGFVYSSYWGLTRDLDTASLLAFTDAGNVWDAGVSISGANLYYNKQLSNGDLLVASYNTNRIHRSTDNGLTWDAGVLVASGAGIRGITQLANGNLVATGYLDNKVYRSTDNGATWDAGTLIAAGAGLSGITQLSNGHVLALGTLTNIVYRSTDNGATWDAGVLVAAGAGLSGITQLSNGTILVTGNTSNKIYRSTDNAATWDAGTTIAGASLNGVTQLASGHVVAVDNTANKIYRSTNNGSTWDAGSLVATGAGIIGISQLANGEVIASAINGRIYKSVKLSAFVRIWYDQSGKNLQATQASVFLQPRIVNAGVIETANGKPAVYFAGSDFLLCNSPTPFPTTGFSGFTANIVAKWTTVGTTISSSQTLLDNNYNGTQGFVIRDRPDLASKPASFGITVAPGTLSTVSDNTQTGNGTTRILSFGADNTTVSGFKEGVAMATSAISGTNYALQNTFGIGASYNNGAISNYLTGHISEIIILSVAPDCNFNSTEWDQGDYYNTTITSATTATLGPPSPPVTVCVNTPIVPITFATTGISGIDPAWGATNPFLPPGVTASYSNNLVTVSGTPTQVGVFNCYVPLTIANPNACQGAYTMYAGGMITVVTNSVSAASAVPTVCTNSILSAITHTTTGATGIGSPTNLPPGVSAAFSNNTIIISGTPTVAGTFNYTIPLTGGCGAASATGTITVTNTGTNNTVGAASSTPTLCVGSVLTPITHATTGATGIGTATGLPAGVTASWANNVITISGTPTALGTFPYSIPLIGGCGAVNATGTINVNSSGAANTAGAASSSPTICAGQMLPNITHATTGATGIGTAIGLPGGLNATWAGNLITISGTPVGYGTFNYAIPLTGGCGTVSATGTITINATQPYITSSLPITAVGTVSTFAGSTFGNLDGTGTAAKFRNPTSVVADALGNLYVADQSNANIRKITPTGVVTTFAGTNSPTPVRGFVNATGTAARFNNPYAIAIDRFGNLFVSDLENNVIRKITPDGVVSTYAGTGAVGNANGFAVSATFNSPTGLATDDAGNVYVVDQGNYVIRKITPAGIVSNFAGSGVVGNDDGLGATASFSWIEKMCSDAAGNLYVSDAYVIRKITPSGMVSTIAGTGNYGNTNGFAPLATFGYMQGIAVDAGGNIYVSDADNNTIRRITPAGIVSTLAGSTYGFANGVGAAARFRNPSGLATDPSGNLFVTEQRTIRKIEIAETVGACIGDAVVLTGNGGTGYTWSGPQAITNGVSFNVTAAGTHTVTVTNGSCSPVTRAITVNVNQPTVTAASNPSVCVSAILPTITRTTTVATGIGSATGLPTGVTATWAANVLTISGIPTDIGTFNYSIPLLGGCPFNATGTITVNDNTVSAASSSPTLCINTPLTPITHTTTGATGISIILGLPAGVTAAWASNTITISGTPTQMGTFNYSIRLAGGCGIDYATGTIRVTSNSVTNTAGSAASSPTVCINTALTNITFATTLATGIGAPTGLPNGVTATWASNVITISGTPTVSGTFPYSIPLTGGCGAVNATGTITVNPTNTAGAASTTPTVCINTALTNITHTTTVATGISNAGVAGANGLPAGVSASWASNTITISGTPTASGTFNYSIPLTGGCGVVNATGTITVTTSSTITRTSAVGTDAQTVCIGLPITTITYATTGATGATVTNLPTGVTANWAANVLTISGTPTVAGTALTYTVTLTGGCGITTTTGTITVNGLTSASCGAFITRWNLATAGSGATQLSFGTATSGTVNYYWQQVTGGTATGSGSFSGTTLTITGLPAGATIRLGIYPTNFQRIIINNGTDRSRLLDVEQWGSTVWTSMEQAFRDCNNLNITASDIPVLTSCTSMHQMFQRCATLNGPTNINSWNTSAVTNMVEMFEQATLFNQNIGSWNTAAVTNMAEMFRVAIAFNQNIGSWNTGAVTNMTRMFSEAAAFNQNIGGWNTGAVTNMSSMFQSATAFNQNIGSWNTGAVTNMSSMFQQATAFNQNIGSWNTAAVTTMFRMFQGASAFNQNISTSGSSWNTGAVTNMSFMFNGATAFNQNIGSWNTGAVTTMAEMFSGATAFNNGGSSTINTWNTAAVTDMYIMFRSTAFNQNIGSWNTGAVTNMAEMFSLTPFNNGGSSTINNWNTAAVTDMGYMFFQNPAFNQNIGGWNTGAVTNMYAMFQNATNFNQNIGSWTLKANVNMSFMLSGSGMDCANYSATLVGWNANPTGPTGRSLGATGRTYGPQATAARANLVGAKGWTITGDALSATGCGAFITRWNLATAGSGATQLSIGTATSGTVNYYWQEVSPGTATGSGSFSGSTLTITGLPAGATIRLGIYPTNFQRININNGLDRSRLLDVEQWGSTVWTSMANAFNGCNNLNITATDIPVLTSCISLQQMFQGCTILNGPTNINSWNTAVVTSMSSMFQSATNFNQNIGSWNTGAVTNMFQMFYFASAFNNGGSSTINNWNTAAVNNMSIMFGVATAFNQNIGSWNTAAVNNMSFMFSNASAFNQNIGTWNTAAVTNMDRMFNGATVFNQNIGSWNTGAVTNMSQMFTVAISFNNGGSNTINNWNTAAVTSMAGMFQQATAFNQNIGSWNTAAVTDMNSMFNTATAFNQNIGSWNTGAVTNMSAMLNSATAFNQNIGSWNLNANVNLGSMLNSSGMDCSNYSATLVGWNTNPSCPTSRTLGATGRTYGPQATAARANLVLATGSGGKGWTITGDAVSATSCGAFITRWNLATAGSGATQLSIGTATSGTVNYYWQQVTGGTATGSGSFSGSTLTIAGLPAGATIRLGIYPTNFQRIIINSGTDRSRLLDVEQWGSTVWTSMQNAFRGCTNLNITATDIPVLTSCTSMEAMFRACTTLNGSPTINSWNTAAVTNMNGLFFGATAFNQNIGSWNTGAVTNMRDMFNATTVFNQNIGSWNTGAVTNMSYMFQGNTAFNQNIGSWNTGAVINMSYMFNGATSFNQNIGNWNTATVTNMSNMFNNATDFNQNIGSWNTVLVANMLSMFNSATSFNQNIGSWNTGAVTNMDGMFYEATAFNQNIGNWNLNPNVILSSMLDYSGMDCSSYAATLVGWNANPSCPTGRTLGATGISYGSTAVAARANLVLATGSGGKGWTITGDAPAVGVASSTPNLCINTALTNITHTTSGATGIGVATGLPAGVTASWASNVITISGTPTASGTFNYSIPLTGGCSSVNATGTITVTPNAAITSITGTSPLCIGAPTTYTANGVVLGGGTGAWSSSNPSVASVNAVTGAVTTLTAGSTNIIYTITGGCGTSSSWTIRNTAADNTWNDIVYSSERSLFVAVARAPQANTNRVMTSPDGITWTARTSANGQWNSVTYGNGLFVAVGSTGSGYSVYAMSSPDGITWTARTVPSAADFQAVEYGNGVFVAVGTGGAIMSSTDGITWTNRSGVTNNWRGLTYAAGLFVAVSTTIPTGNAVMTSPDGITWTSRTPAANNQWYSVVYGNGLFVAVSIDGTNNRVMTSPDGINWTSRTSAANNSWYDVTFANGKFVAVAQNGTGNRVMTSTNGINWSTETSAADNNWRGVAFGNGAFVAVANTGTGNRAMTSSGIATLAAQQSLTVSNDNTAGAASSTPTVIINTALTTITHATTGATGIGASTGLPAGVTATWASNTITISGTPTVLGIFNYSIPLVGGCGAVNATGTITVTRDNDGDGVGDAADGDDDNDGIIDTLECCTDSDGDGVADTLDIDNENDGIPDIEEAGFKAYSNGKSIMDVSAATWVDVNANGINDFIDAMITAGTYLLPDTDGDGVPNFLDLDSDNDSLFDVDEANLLNGDGDSNGDGNGDGLDGDGDGLLNLYDNSTSNGTTARAYAQDTDGNGTPDYMQLDSNSDGVNDIAETLYSALDTNNDGKIDGTVDMDNDGLLDTFDTNTTVKGSPRDLNRKLYLDFDGRNDYGQDATALGVLANETIMAWINLNSAFSATGVIAGQPGFQLRINSSRNLEAVVNGSTVSFSTTMIPYSTAVLNTSQWYHVGAVYDGSIVKLYLNGVMVASGAATGSIASAALTLGKNPSADSNYFRGKIDEVRIFNVALTDLQFQRMVYQEVQNTGSQVRGTIVPKDIQSLPYTSMLRNYRMDAYKDDIVDDVTTATVDTGTGMKIYNHKAIKVQEAPMPFVTRTTGTFATAVNDSSKDIRGMDVMDYDYSIVQVKHDISETANVTNLALFVDPNITITMNNDTKIQNDWYLKLDGKIDLVGKSQLVQTTNSDLDATSAGFAERDQQGNRKLFNYNYWSSPVSSINNSTVNHGFTVNGVMKDGTTATPQNITWTSGINGAATSPITLSSYWIFKFQNSTNTYANWSSVGQNGVLLPGQGFTMKGSGVETANQNYTFVGKPNNGTITSTVGANNLNLCGNPYPSAIDADQFIDDNVASINGTLFFWEHFDTNSSHNTIEYQGGYATYTKVGGTAPVAPLGTSGLGSSNKTPNRFIPVGQGFFVTGSPTGGTITFNNGQRLFVKEDNENSYSLFRTNANPTVSSSAANNNANDSFTTEEFMKLRLGYTSTNSYHRQILLGFMDQNATAGYDEGYDGLSIETLTNDMYFINGTRKLNINGDGFFNVNNIYPIGVKNATSGNVTFQVDGKENFSDGQEIYIHDNVTNTYNSIKSQPYQVNLPAGIYDTRFTLRFTNGSSLGTTDNEENQGIAVIHSQSNNMITIKNVLQEVTVKSVSLFNLLGQQVTNWKIDNQSQADIQLKVSDVTTGTYIVKVFTDGGEITKKILVKK